MKLTLYKFVPIFIAAFLVALQSPVFAQAVNPFEIYYQEPDVATQPELVGNPFEIKLTAKERMAKGGADLFFDNPFEIMPMAGLSVVRKAQQTATRAVRFARFRKLKDANLFWIFAGLLFTLTIAVSLFRSLTSKVYRAFFNDNFLRLLYRRASGGALLGYLLLYLYYVLSLGTFVFLSVGKYFSDIPTSYMLWLSIVGVVFLLSLARHFIQVLIGAIFKLDSIMGVYGFTIIIFNIVLGIALFPVLTVMALSPPAIANVAFWTGLVLIISVLAFSYIRMLFSARRYVSFHTFHFFMYLCAVEIAPVLFLVKWLSNWLVSS